MTFTGKIIIRRLKQNRGADLLESTPLPFGIL